MKRLLTLLTCMTVISCIFFVFTCVSTYAAPKDVFEINLAQVSPANPIVAKQTVGWKKALEKRSNGRLVLNLYFGGSLVGKERDLRRSLIRGICDFASVQNGYDLTNYYLNSVVELPFFGIKSIEHGTRVKEELTATIPEFRDEHKGYKLMWHYVSMPHFLHTSKKQIKTVDEIQGMKLCGFGIMVKIQEALGAAPVQLMPGDVYMGLERGVVEGATASFFPMYALKMLDILKYHLMTPLFWTAQQIIMNEQTYKKLPPDLKKIFDEETENYRKVTWDWAHESEDMAINYAKEQGHHFASNTPEEIEQWRVKAKGYHEKWIAEGEAKGKPARKVYEEAARLIKKYSAEY